MRRLLLLGVVIAGCAASDDGAPDPVDLGRMDAARTSTVAGSDDSGPDVCALAAALPADDICSLVCDPDAMAAQLAADGNDRGFCYQLSCDLSVDTHVLVGVCLPP